MNHHSKTWPLQEAKARLSELIDLVEDGNEQLITRHGKAVARVTPLVPGAQSGKTTLGEMLAFFQNSPMKGVNLKLPKRGKISTLVRKIDFE